MEKAYFDSPIFSLSPYERLEMEQKAQQSSIYDNDLTEMTQGPFGKFAIANRNRDTGRLGWWAGEFLADPFDNTSDYPLNLTKSKVDMDPMRDHISISMDNNPETIVKDLQDVPFEQWSYILSAKTYGQYKDRIRFVKAGLPMAEGLGYGGIVGTLGDVGGMLALGFAGESVALAGLGARTTLAGRAAAASSGTWRFQTPAVAALEAAQTVSKGNLALRFGALGVAEAAVYQAARTGLDPVYEPTAGEVIWELTASGAIGAGLGGYAFGRSLVKDRIEDAARELRASRTVDLPGGYTVTYADRLSFDSVAAADTLLFRGGSLETEAFRIGQDLWKDWQRSPNLFIPGTRSVSLPVLDEAAAARQAGAPTPVVQPPPAVTFGIPINRIGLGNRKWLENTVEVRAGERGFESGTPYPQARAAANREREMTQANLTESPVPLMGPTVFRETGSDSAFNLLSRIEQGPRTHEPFFVSDNPDLALSQDKKGVFIELDASLINGRLNRAKPLANKVRVGQGTEFIIDKTLVGSVKSLTFKNKQTFERFKKQFADVFDFDNSETTERGLKVLRKPNAKTSKVAAKGEEPIFTEPSAGIAISETPVVQAPKAASEVRDVFGRIPARPKIGQVVGLRSVISAAAFELSLAGMRLSDDVFAKVTEALIVTERSKLTGGAFNKKFWEEVSKRIDPEVAAKIRTKDRAFIGGIDRTVQDAVVRDDMIDSIHVAFRNGEHLDPANPKSLIFQVLQEIKSRGGTVNRQTIGEIVDELRAIAQKPPTRVNAKGKEVLDTNARRLAVAQIVNKRVKEGKGIYIPDSLLKKMTAVPGARTATGEVVDFIGPRQQTPSGLAPDATFDSAPKASRFLIEKLPFWSAIGNQAARVLESNNGAARTIAWLSFHARRSFGVAQKQTVMEAGTATLHMMMFGFLRGYRNQYIRFALGNGNANAPVEQVNLMGLFKTAFGKSEVRREFNKRVAQQLRTGTYDDALESVNEAAKGFRELLNKVHNIAEQAGVRGFTKSAVVNYMPRLWRFDKIRRLATTEEGKKDLIALVRQAMDQRGRRVVIDGVEQTFTEDIDQAAIAFANRLIAIATKTENAPTLQHEQELFDALSELTGPIKANTPSRTPFGRGRILIDETSSVRMTGDHLGDGKATLSIADLTNDDLPFVFRKYLTSVMGAVNERRLISAFNDELRIRGILGPRYVTKDGEVLKDVVEVNTVDEMLALARKIGGEIEAGHEQGLREVIAALRYEPIHSGSAGLMDRVLGIMIPYGYLTTGGQFGLAAFGEVSRLVSTLGWRQILRQMPIMSEMIGNYKNLDKEAKNFASFIDTWFAPSTDRLRRSFMDVTGAPSGYDTGGGLGYRYAKRAVDGASNVLSDISGLAPITSFTQQLAAAGILQHLYDVSKGTKRMSAATIRTLGLEPDEYERAIKFVAENAEVRRGFMGDRITGLKNLDAVEMDLVKSLVQRTVTTRIQDVPTRGDFHKNLFSWWGRLLTQFQTFNLKGVDNFLIQNAGRARNGASAEVIQDIGATMLLAGTIQYLRTYADYESYKAAGDKEKMEEYEERLTVGGFLRGAANGPSEFFLPVRATDAFWTNFVDEDPLFSQYRYSGLGWAGFPGEAMVRRAWEVRGDLYGASVGKKFDLTLEREITRGTLHKMRLLAPAQNLPGLKHYFNILEDEIADAYGLPEQQPRRKKNKD